MADVDGLVTPEASIIVPTARDGARLTAALDRLPGTIEGVSYELIVVLDDADPDVVAAARGRADVDALLAPDNGLGFAGACNLGRGAARGEFLVLLHDDTEPRPGWLARLLATLRERPSAGVAGPLVLQSDGTVAGAGQVLFGDGTSHAPGRGRPPAEYAGARPRQADYCGSSAVVVRTAAWDAFGGLEEALFPAGYVDVDLAFSARRAGWEVWFDPGAVVVHDAGGSQPPGYRTWVHQRNRDVFLAKWADAVADLEPRNDRDLDGSVARAIGRAQRRRPQPAPQPPRPGPPAREVDLLRAYVAEQDRWAAGIHREWPLLYAELAALRGRGWHLRNRLRRALGR